MQTDASHSLFYHTFRFFMLNESDNAFRDGQKSFEIARKLQDFF